MLAANLTLFYLLCSSSLVAANLAHRQPQFHKHHAKHNFSPLERGRLAKRAACIKSFDPSAVSTSAAVSGTGTAGPDGNSSDQPKTYISTSDSISYGSWWASNGGGGGKLVVAHFIVGNAYSYTPSQWASEIGMAKGQGIDAFALNFGSDSWQPARIQDAYNTAASHGFKMFISFDMTVLNCGDNSVVSSIISQYKSHPAQLKDGSGAVIVSTFDGGSCKSNGQWQAALSASGANYRFVPAFFNDLTSQTLKSIFPVVGGDLLWGGAWPKGDTPINWSEDQYRLSRDGISGGDLYATTVSPWFFTHFDYKNFIWHVDDHLYARRWEDLFSHRGQVDMVEIVSWNDYGESTYIGPIGKDQPGSQAWVNGFHHTAFLEMTGYYAAAFKTGSWPQITADKIFIWGRPNGVNDAASDGLGRPERYDWVSDKLWVVLFAIGSGSLTVTQGSSSQTFQVSPGVNKFSLPLGVASGVTAALTRGGNDVFAISAPIAFDHSASSYNFNANAASGP